MKFRTISSLLNGMNPAAKGAQLGTRIESLITQVNALRADLARVYLQNAFVLTAPVLRIKAAGSGVVKSSGAFAALVAGVKVSKNADTDMSAIAGSLATAKSALWAFYIDSAGTITTSTKTADAATAAAALALKPAVPVNKAELGYIIVSNASGSAFTAGTTALDMAGVTTTYVNATPVSAMTAATLDSIAE